jgi:hypothetical protein
MRDNEELEEKIQQLKQNKLDKSNKISPQLTMIDNLNAEIGKLHKKL